MKNLGLLGIEPRAAGFGGKNTNHCAMFPPQLAFLYLYFNVEIFCRNLC